MGKEVGFYDLRVDLYGYSAAAHKSLAVELKLSKWRRAFVQALQYRLCADEAVIALPASRIARIDLDLLGAHGIGLLSVTRYGCVEVLAPRSFGIVRKDYQSQMIDQLFGASYACLTA
ncbi:MAG: hypothetical protein WA190_17650 [Usitatibacter sp.]